jgi:precorrin-2 dehydrogenase/sirohydrochlorin ferrochelatase
MLPITVNLDGRLGVVVGGGTVGQHKADALLAAGGRVHLISLDAAPPQCPPGLTWITEPYRREHLAGAALVIAAATAEINRVVVADARGLGLWVCSATEPEAGDFALPAVMRRGRLTISVSTGGAAPALARRIAGQLEVHFDDTFADWLDLLAELRPVVLARIADPVRRRQLLESWCEPRWRERLRHAGTAAVREALLAEVEVLTRASDSLS